MLGRSVKAIAILLVGMSAACSAGGGNSGVSGSHAGGNTLEEGGIGGAGNASTGGSGGLLIPESGPVDATQHVATLQGRVVAPEGTIPISGALVYLAYSPPPPIPDGVFCDECVKLDPDDEYTLTSPDGSFSLLAHSTGSRYLVVQKGQFRKVRPIQIEAGDQQVDPEFTRLPARMNKAAGEDIPKMAIIVGKWDSIELSLAKLGLAKIVPGFLGSTVDPATAGFDMIQGVFPPDLSDPMKNPTAFLKNYDYLKRYHIIFIPCSGSDGTTCTDTVPDNKTVQDNLKRFVSEGGKLYVTDYSYEYVRRPWPGFVNWDTETSATGSACLSGEYDAPATVEDQEMREWLLAQGIDQFEVEANWTRISALHTLPGFDPKGAPIDVTPKTWVKGSQNPATISFEDRCGRVLFFHLSYRRKWGKRVARPRTCLALRIARGQRLCRSPHPAEVNTP
ncbi:MAG TPA: hypothetical protein PLH51_00765 [Polyangiaceae bacterium]|nr:hypothetical protein [Polyangiaceae bacterium]HPK91932.1 hypothetical protein [Polyangiaceae bacterium]